jgi:hypothetical protein
MDGTILYGVPKESTALNLASVTTLHRYSMGYYKGATILDFPQNVTTIGVRALLGNYAEKIIFRGNVTLNDQCMMFSDYVKAIILTGGCVSIGGTIVRGGFGLLKSFILDYESTSIPSLRSDSFNMSSISSGICYIYVPSTMVDNYKTQTNWSNYENQIKPINVADALPDIGSVAENDLYKIGEVYWKAEMVDNVLTWVEI